MKVSELTGAKLDYWVAKAEGKSDVPRKWAPAFINELGRCSIANNNWDCARYYEPSKNWGHGGPIIEREQVRSMYYEDEGWGASVFVGEESFDYLGPTPLIAAMRAYVASKFGEEVPE